MDESLNQTGSSRFGVILLTNRHVPETPGGASGGGDSLLALLGAPRHTRVRRGRLHQQVVPVVVGQENVPCFLSDGSTETLGSSELVLTFHEGQLVRILILIRIRVRVRVRAHLRHGGASVAGAGVAPHGVHERVGGEGVVRGPGAHVLLEALDDGPVGPGETQEKPETLSNQILFQHFHGSIDAADGADSPSGVSRNKQGSFNPFYKRIDIT